MEQRNNSGVIFKNNYKKTDKHPDFKGKCIIKGEEVEISLWTKKDKNDNVFFGAQFSEPFQGEVEQNRSVNNEDAIYDTKIAESDDNPF